jgi:NADH:ubiquinone oxidoreductase subunit 3 (subunit A)
MLTLVQQQYAGLGLIALTLAGLLAALVWALRRGPRRKPFESGARTEHKTWVQYRIRYAVLALLFVAFDMEMVFMFPWAVVYRRLGLIAFGDLFVFVAILAAAVVYAWKEGVFDWED